MQPNSFAPDKAPPENTPPPENTRPPAYAPATTTPTAPPINPDEHPTHPSFYYVLLHPTKSEEGAGPATWMCIAIICFFGAWVFYAAEAYLLFWVFLGISIGSMFASAGCFEYRQQYVEAHPHPMQAAPLYHAQPQYYPPNEAFHPQYFQPQRAQL